MKVRSIAQKFGIWLVLVTLFVMIIFGIINYFLFINQLNNDLNIRLTESTSKVSDLLALHVWNLDNSRVQEVAQDQAFLESFARLRVFDSFGDLIYETEQLAEEDDPVYIKRDIQYEENVAGSIEASFSTTNLEIAKSAVIQSTLVIIFVVTLTVLVLAFFIARSISRPIVSLTNTARDIASGDLSKRATVTSEDEVGILAQTFNSMIEKLEGLDKAKSEFITITSHQLRTPLGAIKLFTEMLINKKDKTFDTTEEDYLSNIHESSTHMAKLVNDLLNISHIEAGKLTVTKQNTDVAAFLKTVIDEILPLAKKKGSDIVFREPQKELPELLIDQDLLRQVIENLLANSIQYLKKEHPGVITVTLTPEKAGMIITVKDNGIGIPHDSQKRIFEKFFRADNAMKQETDKSGLGLYVVKKMIDALGGKIWFESSAEGTTFYVSLPKKGVKKEEVEQPLV